MPSIYIFGWCGVVQERHGFQCYCRGERSYTQSTGSKTSCENSIHLGSNTRTQWLW